MVCYIPTSTSMALLSQGCILCSGSRFSTMERNSSDPVKVFFVNNYIIFSRGHFNVNLWPMSSQSRSKQSFVKFLSTKTLASSDIARCQTYKATRFGNGDVREACRMYCINYTKVRSLFSPTILRKIQSLSLCRIHKASQTCQCDFKWQHVFRIISLQKIFSSL